MSTSVSMAEVTLTEQTAPNFFAKQSKEHVSVLGDPISSPDASSEDIFVVKGLFENVLGDILSHEDFLERLECMQVNFILSTNIILQQKNDIFNSVSDHNH